MFVKEKVLDGINSTLDTAKEKIIIPENRAKELSRMNT